MNIKLINATIRNFMSYGNNTTTIELDRPGTTLILGEDLDNTASGTRSNGVGKSVIINALSYALYGKPVSNISLDNLINNINKKNMEVSITFEKNNTFYHVVRVRKSRSYAAGNYVKFFVKKGSGEFTSDDERTRDSVAKTNEDIENVIGIPHELFCRIVVFSAIHRPFLDLPIRHPTQECQTRIIEELFDLTTLTEKAELLKQKIKDNEQSLTIKQSRIDQLKEEHQRHKQQVAATERRLTNWNTERNVQITDLKSKLKKVADVDIDGQRKAHEQRQEIQRQLSEETSEKREIEQILSSIEREINKKEKELVHLREDKCPYCLQRYADAETKISQIQHAVDKKRVEAQEIRDAIEEYSIRIDKLSEKKRLIEQSITVQNIKELIQIKSKASSYEVQIKDLEQQTNPFIEPLEELQQVKLDPINEDEVKSLGKTIEHQQFLYKLLTKKDSFVRKTLLNKNIPFLNGRLQQYLSELGLQHIVEFTHELTANITQFGRPLEFGNLSNGQKARVNFALSLAFRDILQNLHQRINVCMLDEVLDIGLDTIGVKSAAKLLKRKARDEKTAIYIISHRDEIDSAFDHRIVVQMSGGFSNIKETE